MKTEWNTKVSIDEITHQDVVIDSEADPETRQSLADRFDLGSVESLLFRVSITAHNQGMRVQGVLKAQFHYLCRVTRQPFPAQISEPVDIVYLPEALLPPIEEATDHGYDLDALDPEGVDIAEAAATSFALALDPFPRGPDADQALERLGIETEEQARQRASPFGRLVASNTDEA